LGADAAGREEAVEPRPGSKVEHGLAGLQGGECDRVAAPQAEVGAGRDGLQTLVPVADLPADLVVDQGHLAGRAAPAPGRAAAGAPAPGDLSVVLSHHLFQLIVGHVDTSSDRASFTIGPTSFFTGSFSRSARISVRQQVLPS